MAFISIQGASTSQSSLPSSPIWWKYHVFFSFRGIDTRHSFTDHLCTALKQKGIFIFRDDERLARGKPIAPELFKAIKESRFAVVILSRKYASSTWCLKELAKIVKCKKKKGLIILPVFYHVKPSDVRKQSGSFKQAFAKYEVDNIHEVETWRAAFTEVANISGWDIDKRTSEIKVIQSIVDHISHWDDYKCNPIFVVLKSSRHSVEIIKCRVYLIYKQDVDELNQTIAQYNSSCVTTFVGSDCVHHELENLAVVKATKIMRTYDDNNETQCSASWSHLEETERAMGKTKDEVKESKTEQFRRSKSMQCLLPEKLANETIKGNKPSITFMPGSFTRAATAIRENFEAHPDSDQYLNKKIEMDLVLGKDKATWNSAKSVMDTDSEKGIVDLESYDIDIIDSEKASKGKQVSFSNAALSQARSNRKRSRANVNQYENYDKCFEKLEKIELEIKKLKKDEPDVKKLYEEVMKTQGFEEVMLGNAFDYLLNNERVAQGFMVKNAKLRKSWLERFFKENGV